MADYPVLDKDGKTIIAAPGYDTAAQYPVKDGEGDTIIPAPPEPEPDPEPEV